MEASIVKHLACIMDGNRRWARAQGMISWMGHKEGLAAAKRVAEFCLQKQIPILSLYTFSLENFTRPTQELAYLFGDLAQALYAQVTELIEKNIRIQFIGDRSLFPEHLVALCEDIEKRTYHCAALTINLLFCYGARQEIVSGVKKIAQKVHAGLLTHDAINETVVQEHLWTHGMPEPDLIIRTGGVKRLSNFLLYQAAYAELYFLECMWPELQHEHLEQVLHHFSACQRNFGR